MSKFMRIVKSVGILTVVLMVLPVIAIKSGISKLFGSHSSNGMRNKIHELDKLAGSLSGIAQADVLSGDANEDTSSCGCGHDSGGY